MASIFRTNVNNQQISERQNLQNKYNICRANLLLVVIFSVVNMVLPAVGSQSYFLFSAFVPFFLAYVGADATGMFPDEFYATYYAPGEFEPADISVLIVMLAIALVIVALYFLCWIMSKKHGIGWIITALVLFGLDTVMMFLIQGFAVDSIIDILFHAWVIYYLIVGIVSYLKLKNLPEEDPIAAEWEVQPATETAETAPIETEIDPETTESAPVEEAADPQNEDHGREC